MNELLLAFIPLFVAIDVLGLVPIFLSLTEKMDGRARHRLVTDATVTAAALSVAFLFFGTAVFAFLGITEDDFRVVDMRAVWTSGVIVGAAQQLPPEALMNHEQDRPLAREDVFAQHGHAGERAIHRAAHRSRLP